MISILQAVWEAADYPWSVRLKALLPQWMPWIRRQFRLTPEIEEQLLRISARAIDYRLGPRKRVLRKRIYGRTKPGTLLKQQIPVKTDRWDVQVPGFTEIDLVSHSGPSAAGECCHSLNLTDIHSTWVETRAVLGKGQEGVRQALEEIRQALPFALRGIDSDNGSEFINAHLYGYCRSRAIQFTRGRPYKKDDNAHIEQKNWTHVRRLLGYARYDSQRALKAINDLYAHELGLFRNLFLPSVKLQHKVRMGSRTRRIYGVPETPFQRETTAAAARSVPVVAHHSGQVGAYLSAQPRAHWARDKPHSNSSEGQRGGDSYKEKNRPKRKQRTRTGGNDGTKEQEKTTAGCVLCVVRKRFLSQLGSFHIDDAGEGGLKHEFTSAKLPPSPAPLPPKKRRNRGYSPKTERNSCRVTFSFCRTINAKLHS